MLLSWIAVAAAGEGAIVCAGTLKTPTGSVAIQAFGPDFDAAGARVVEHGWTVAEFHQHTELWQVFSGDETARAALVSRYAGLNASSPPRVPGYRVTAGACEALPVARSDGDWDATWSGTAAAADEPWVALELARRSACFGAYQDTPGSGVSELTTCLAKAPTTPTVRRDALPGPSQTAPRYLCTADGWDGGGVGFDAARLDALDARLVGVSRVTTGTALGDLDQLGALATTPTLKLVDGDPTTELATVRCAPPGRPLRTESGAQCSGAASSVTLSPQGDLAEVSALCHDAAVAPTYALLPGSQASIVPGAIGLAARCDAVCRRGFDAGSYPIE